MKKKSFLYFFKHIIKNKKSYFLIIILMLLINVISNILQVILPKQIIELILIKKFDTAIIVSISMCLLIFITQTINNILTYHKYKKEIEINDFYKIELSNCSKKISYDKFQSHEFRNRYSFSLKCVGESIIPSIINNIYIIVCSISTIVSLMYIVSYLTWWLWIFLGLTIIVSTLCEIYRYKYNFRSYESQEEIEMKMLYARDRLTWKEFAKEVRIFDMYNYVTRTANEYINQLSSIQKKRAKQTFLSLSISYILNGVQLFIIYSYVGFQCYNGVYSIGEFTTIILAISSIFNFISSIVSNAITISDKKQYADYYYDFVNSYKFDDKELELSENLGDINEIILQNISFKYDNNENNILKNINYTFHSNKKYGIVGVNGSGKTTLMNIIMSLYKPTCGKVIFNNINAEDINIRNIYEKFSVVTQDYNIYAYSIGENISMEKNIKNDKVLMLIKKLGLYDKLKTCNYDLNTFITNEYDENGIEFSGGEKQKIAICRALYKEAPILILDEPTASLSPKAEFEIYNLINEVADNKIVFFISHRMISCKMCDEILVIDDGKIVESGTHKNLLLKNGVYKSLYEAQVNLYGGEQNE